MSRILLIISLVLACLACRTMSQAPESEHSSGVLEKAEEANRVPVERVRRAHFGFPSDPVPELLDRLKEAAVKVIEKVKDVLDKVLSDGKPQL